MNHGLTENVLKNIATVFGNYEKIYKALLYGSRAKGTYKNGSDIDLALLGENINLVDLHKIMLDLDVLYLPYTFDLVIFKNIKNNDLIDHISRIGVSIYNKP